MSDPQPQPDTKAAIIEWLQLRGYRDEEVAKIMAKLAAHDDQTRTHPSSIRSAGERSRWTTSSARPWLTEPSQINRTQAPAAPEPPVCGSAL